MIASIVALTAATAASASPADGHLLAPAEVFAAMERSSVKYRVDEPANAKDAPVERWAELLWPERVKPLELPTVEVAKGGRRTLRPIRLAPGVEELLKRSEPLFQARRYAEAAALYEEALKLDPSCWLLWANLGDCFLFRDDPETALRHYQRATALGPDDHRPWFYAGRALEQLGRPREALEAYVTSLVLKPRNPILLAVLKRSAARLGVEVRDEPLLVPRGFARREGEAVGVYADLDAGPHWLAFAACKALWLGEPEHRRALTGSAGDTWSSRAELECLAGLLSAYEAGRKDGKIRVDPRLEELNRVAEEGMTNELILYEVASRLHPQVTLTLSDAERARIRRYVLGHVVLGTGLK